MTLGKTVPCQNDPSKGVIDNYIPIACLPLIWTLMIETIIKSIYNFFDLNNNYQLNKKDARKKK